MSGPDEKGRLSDGAIGRLATVRTALTVSAPPGDIRRSVELGGGALGDLRMPGDVLAQLDIGLDLTRRDELELIGTDGRLTVPDPWLCRSGHLELDRDGQMEHVPVDPDGSTGLTDPEHDVYQIELDTSRRPSSEATNHRAAAARSSS